MKKIVLLLVFTAAAAVVWSEDFQAEFTGKWLAQSFIIEQEDGLLVASEADYSYPYLGITGIDFIDSSFIVFTVSDTEYRAFYEIESLDFDNYYVRCTFKSSEEFLLKLVRVPGGNWKYFYRVAEDSILKGFSATVIEEEMKESGIDDAMVIESEPEEVVENIYVGIMTKE